MRKPFISHRVRVREKCRVVRSFWHPAELLGIGFIPAIKLAPSRSTNPSASVMLRMAATRRTVLRITVIRRNWRSVPETHGTPPASCDSRIGQYPFLQKIVPCLTVYLLLRFLPR